MSQDQESQITKGFVVGSNRGGKEWVVRVKDDSSPINGRKLVVGSVKVGTKLAPGQDVQFIPDIDANLATYLEVLPKVRVVPPTTNKTGDKLMQVAEAIRQVAIITYNRIGGGEYQNGAMDAHGIRLFVAQNGHKSEWAADPDHGDAGSRAQTRSRMARHVAQMIEMKEMNHVFIYVGSNGSESAIRESAGLPADRVTYVMCDCNWGSKVNLIRSIGNSGSRIIECSCGGRDKLASIARQLLAGENPKNVN